MSEFLGDPAWQLIGPALGVAGLLVAWLMYRAQRKRKILSYERLFSTPLVSVEAGYDDRLQILFDNRPIPKACLVGIRIVNSGDVPVASIDYERDLRLVFDSENEVLTARISETDPHSLGASIKIDGCSVLIAPVLLNSGDSLTVQVLLREFYGSFSLEGRVAGVKSIGPLTHRGRQR